MIGEGGIVPGRLTFPNGYIIDVEEIWQGQALYIVWPPDERQGWAHRRPIAEFAALVDAEGGVYSRYTNG